MTEPEMGIGLLNTSNVNKDGLGCTERATRVDTYAHHHHHFLHLTTQWSMQMLTQR